MISARDLRFYDQAIKLAEISNCNQQHGAIITKGATVIAMGVNKRRTHPISRKYSGFDSCSVHAEQMAIIAARSDLRNCILYSARANGTQKSKPCNMCNELIYYAGIKFVVYFDGQQLIKERL